jgi:N-acetylneuraminate synthase
MYISYAKGVRTWERHIDIPYPPDHEQKEISKYCSLPHQIDEWFKAFNQAKIMCGTARNERRIIDDKESAYLEALYRGLYLKDDLKKGTKITLNHLYSAVPYQKEINHNTSRQYFDGDYILIRDLAKDAPLTEKDIKRSFYEVV